MYFVLERFKLERGAAMAIDLTTLVGLESNGDLESFLSTWDYTLMSLSKQPDEDLVHTLLETQLRKCKAIGPSFVLYDASPEGHPNRSSAFIYSAARAEVV